MRKACSTSLDWGNVCVPIGSDSTLYELQSKLLTGAYVGDYIGDFLRGYSAGYWEFRLYLIWPHWD